MAIAVAATTTSAYQQTTTPSVTVPSGTATGDLLLIIMNTRIDGTDPSSSGWTKIIKQDDQATNAYLGGYAYYKIADGTEGSSITFSIGGNFWTSMVCYRITGFDSSTPIATSNGANVANSNAPSFAGAITPTTANSLIIMGIFATSITTAVGSYAIATSDPGGWTETIDQGSTSPSGVGVWIASAYATRAQITSTGNFSCAGGVATTDWAGFILAVNPSTVNKSAFFNFF